MNDRPDIQVDNIPEYRDVLNECISKLSFVANFRFKRLLYNIMKHSDMPMADLAKRSGISDRQLRRIYDEVDIYLHKQTE